MLAQNTLRTYTEKRAFITFVTDVYLNRCLEQIELPMSLHTCAPVSELLSNYQDFTYLFVVVIVNISRAEITNTITDIIRFFTESDYFLYFDMLLLVIGQYDLVI